MTRVSVVIPAYNAVASLEGTLDGVRAQTLAPSETIVVDDGSTDGTSDLAHRYLAHTGMAGRVVEQRNLGVSAARNVGLRAATAPFVALLDADDRWHPDKLRVVMDEFERHPEADLICHDEAVVRDGRVQWRSRRRLASGNAYEALLFGGNQLSPSATVLKRTAALEVGGFDERRDYATVEDYDFWMRFARAYRIYILPRVLGEYVISDRSTSQRIVAHHAALERMLRDHLEAYLRVHPGWRSRVRARRRLAQVYRSAARQLIAQRIAPGDQQAFIGRMLRAYPWQPRNAAVALLWLAGRVNAYAERGGRSGTMRA